MRWKGKYIFLLLHFQKVSYNHIKTKKQLLMFIADYVMKFFPLSLHAAFYSWDYKWIHYRWKLLSKFWKIPIMINILLYYWTWNSSENFSIWLVPIFIKDFYSESMKNCWFLLPFYFSPRPSPILQIDLWHVSFRLICKVFVLRLGISGCPSVVVE